MTAQRNTTQGEWKPIFLKALTERGNVYAACRAADISRQLAYQTRAKHERFQEQWDQALQVAVDRLEHEAWARAEAGSNDKSSATLLIFLLKAHRRELYGHANANGSEPTDLMAQMIAAFAQAMGKHGNGHAE